MTHDIYEFLETKIKKGLGAKVTPGEFFYLPASVFTEFTDKGKLNYARISTKYDIYCSFREFIDAVSDVFGTLNFKTDKNAASTITKEDFLDMYEFGVFTSVRDWQYAVYVQKNKYISLKDLFEWVLETK